MKHKEAEELAHKMSKSLGPVNLYVYYYGDGEYSLTTCEITDWIACYHNGQRTVSQERSFQLKKLEVRERIRDLDRGVQTANSEKELRQALTLFYEVYLDQD